MREIKKLVKDKNGNTTPLTIALILALLFTLCALSEFFRLSVIKEMQNGYEYRLSNLSVDIKNVRLRPGSAVNNLEVTAKLRLEIPISFGGESFPPVQMQIKVKSAYMPKFE